MNNLNKLVSAAVIGLISAIFCMDVLIDVGFKSFMTCAVHCVAVGVVVLMFSRELGGDFYR